jgi:hypothetical protein
MLTLAEESSSSALQSPDMGSQAVRVWWFCPGREAVRCIYTVSRKKPGQYQADGLEAFRALARSILGYSAEEMMSVLAEGGMQEAKAPVRRSNA